MAEQINGLAITRFEGGVDAEGLFVNGNPVVAVSASNLVIIGVLGDFPDPVVGVITLANNTLYRVTTNVDIGSNVIEHGINSVIEGFGLLISSLTTSSSSPLLSLNVVVRSITLIAIAPIVVSGSDLKCEKVSIAGHVTGVLINNSPSAKIEDLQSIGGESNIVVSGSSNGFIEISGGTQSGFSTFGVNISGSTTQVMIMAGVIFDGAGVSFIGDFGGGNVSDGLIVSDCAFIGSATPLVGVSEKNTNYRFTNNIDVPDSKIIGAMEQIANASTTTLINSVAVQLAGTFSASASIERFNVSSDMLVAEVDGSGLARISMDGGGDTGGSSETYEIVLLQNGTPNAIFRRVTVDTSAGSIGLDVPITWVATNNFSIGVRRISGVRDWLTANATLIIS